MTTSRFRSILITGGSSGIGAALAQELAAQDVSLALTGRNEERLEEVATACRAKGAITKTAAVDVTDAQAMKAFVDDCDDARPLDLVVANAGISAGTSGGAETSEQTRHIVAVNVEGVMNTVLPAIERMRPRRSGQVGIVSSVAGFRGFPGAPAYCASKAAVKVWGESLRGWLYHDGIGVSVIMPGFVESRITAVNKFPMPFLMSADRAARIIRRGLEKNKGRIAFPLPTVFSAWLAGALPDALIGQMTRELPEK